MSIHNLVAELIAAGTPPQLVTAVCEIITDNALLRLQLATDNARRARDAERKRNSRENVRGCPVTVTGHEPAYIEEKKDKIKKASICKIVLPADFELNDSDKATCQKAGWDPVRTAAELQRFRDHATANARRQVDWHASWRNWVTSPLQTPPKPNGGTNGHHANPAAIRRTSDAVNETLARRQERFRFG